MRAATCQSSRTVGHCLSPSSNSAVVYCWLSNIALLSSAVGRFIYCCCPPPHIFLPRRASSAVIRHVSTYRRSFAVVIIVSCFLLASTLTYNPRPFIIVVSLARLLLMLSCLLLLVLVLSCLLFGSVSVGDIITLSYLDVSSLVCLVLIVR